jgi:hypothetical protein
VVWCRLSVVVLEPNRECESSIGSLVKRRKSLSCLNGSRHAEVVVDGGGFLEGVKSAFVMTSLTPTAAFGPPEPALYCNSRCLLVPLHVISDALVGSTLG